jgi:hypothetical protein
MAIGTTLVWIKELYAPHMKQHLLQRREGDHLVWPHIVIEAATAALLFISGVASLFNLGWAPIINYFSLGAITYACFNSLSWTLANRNRWAYTVYMLFGVLGSVILLIKVMQSIVGM